jgi:hypothetical protein
MGKLNSLGRTPEEKAAAKAAIDALTAEAKENWGDPAWHYAMAQQITETIMEGFEHENLLELMTTVETTELNGRIVVKETRGLRAHWVSRGGYIEASNVRTQSMELRSDTIGFHVYEHEDKLRTNFGETQADLIDMGVERLQAEINLRVLRTFQAAIPDSSDYYISGAGVDLSTLDEAINEVIDESKDDTITIVGRRPMVGQIADQIGDGSRFTPETNEELLARGVLGTYKGARLVYLKNFKDDEDVSFFPANELFVMGRDASKAGFWGDLQSKEWTDPNWYWHYVARRDFGIAVHRPERARRIVDTTITP